nr:MAG TPA: hypothetical protein [Caudoviricetes sp.]
MPKPFSQHHSKLSNQDYLIHQLRHLLQVCGRQL